MPDLYLGLQGYNFFKKESPTQVFSYEDCEIFMNSYFEEHLQTAASALNGFFRTTSF